MDLESSTELLQKAQAGDSAALEALLARYRPRLKTWATGRLPRFARAFTDTEDLIQDALIGTFRNIRGFETRGEWALQAYLRRAVANRVRDELRRHASHPSGDVEPDGLASDDQSPLEITLGKETFARYDAALERLDEVEREAVIARAELGCSYQEIAQLIDKPSADAARMTVARALRKLACDMA